MKLIFASNNLHKIEEIRSYFGEGFEFITMKEAGIDIDIPEPHETLEENAREKSTTIFRLTQQNCFSEDTGLEVDALNGEPGVKSARYSGEDRNYARNTNYLLQKMDGITNRAARFRAVASLIMDGKEYQFEGVCEGSITTETYGDKGFGYDPVFKPEGSTFTFAEMSLEEKNKYNHRRIAIEKMAEFLKNRR
ncbi:MAG: RdgB/HAM1 family non-canonical purine NTP pyrophosphatase [Sphingobacteriales bacterium]|nr:RdgB/HAM1 family non-canonical purine NTP pyrophosphatase [Sphingobacteriales bacterium]